MHEHLDLIGRTRAQRRVLIENELRRIESGYLQTESGAWHVARVAAYLVTTDLCEPTARDIKSLERA